jgi:hypothetical protein
LSLFYNFWLAIEAKVQDKVQDILEAKPGYKEAKNGLSTWELLELLEREADRNEILSKAISKGFLPIAHDLKMACAIFLGGALPNKVGGGPLTLANEKGRLGAIFQAMELQFQYVAFSDSLRTSRREAEPKIGRSSR